MPIYIHGDESGDFGSPYFCIGLTFIDSTLLQECKTKIEQLRQIYKYDGEISYKELNFANLALARALVDLFFTYEPIVFRANVIVPTKWDIARYVGHYIQASPQELAYNDVYMKTVSYWIKKQAGESERAIMLAHRKTKRRAEKFRDYMLRSIPQLVDFQEVDSKRHHILQLTDLLLGVIGGDLRRVRDRIKRQVIDVAKGHLGIRNFRHRPADELRKKYEIYFRKIEKVKKK